MPSAADNNDIPRIKANGRSISDDAADRLVYLHVDRARGSTAALTMRFNIVRDDREAVSSTFRVGDAVSVGVLARTGEEAEVFSGTVVSIGLDLGFHGKELVIGIYDGAYVLGRESVTMSHVDATWHDLLSKIASDAGLKSDVDSSLRGETFESIQQTGTPQQFLSSITEATGTEWFVDGDVLHVRPRKSSGSVDVDGLEELRRFDVRYSTAESTKSVTVRGWDPARKESFVGAESARGSHLSDIPQLEQDRNAGPAVSFPQPVASEKAAQERAKSNVARMESTMLTGRGEVDVDADIKPGVVLNVTGLDTAWNGTYYVTGVEHVYGDKQPFVTRFTIGALEPTTLVDLFGAPQRTSAEHFVDGITIGVVTNVQDTEGLCRVKVHMPYLADDSESGWARLVQQGAGEQRGWVAVPEVGDEVAVAFENGDIQRPMVLGGLWNGKDKPPVEKMGDDGKIGSRSFTSRAGHQLMFNDGTKPAELFVAITLGVKGNAKTSNTVKLLLAEDKVVLDGNGAPIEVITKNAQINLEESGEITLKGKDIKLDASGKITLKAKQGVEVSSNAAVKLDGAMLDLKGKSKASLDGGGMTEIKGGMVKVN